MKAWGDNAIVVFKEKSIDILENLSDNGGGLAANATRTRLSGEIGLASPSCITDVGKDLWFLSERGIFSVSQALDNKLQSNAEPLSAPMEPVFRRINWNVKDQFRSAFWENAFYLAVALDDSKKNNAIIKYSFITNSWHGYHTSEHLDAERMFVNFVNAEKFLFYITNSGAIYRMYVGYEDEGLEFDTIQRFSNVLPDFSQEAAAGGFTYRFKFDGVESTGTVSEDSSLADIITELETIPALNGNVEFTRAVPTEDRTETTRVDTTGATTSLSGGEYFNIYSAADATQYYVWMDTNGDGTTQDPAPGGTGIVVDISGLSLPDDDGVASAIQSAMDANADFTAVVSTNKVDITTVAAGVTTSATDNDTGYDIKIVVEGGARAFVAGVAETNDLRIFNGRAGKKNPLIEIVYVTLRDGTRNPLKVEKLNAGRQPICSTVWTRGYGGADLSRKQFRKVFVDASEWCPCYSIAVATDGVNEEVTTEPNPITRNRTKYHTIGTPAYETDNDNDDHGAAYREDYSVKLCGLSFSFPFSFPLNFQDDCDAQGTYDLNLGDNGVNLNLMQRVEVARICNMRGDYMQVKIDTTEGRLKFHSIKTEGFTHNRTATISA
jgi:hypothetical protein